MSACPSAGARKRFWTRLRLTPSNFGMILLFGLFYLFLSNRPLWHTDLWGHLAYGRLIVANRALPPTEPLMPLARGTPFVDLSWLSQVLGYAAFQWKGIAAIQFLYAASITASLGLLAWRTARKTASMGPALLAVSVCVWLQWQQLLIVRPQLAGLVCFLLLFVALLGKKPGKTLWLFVPLLFVLWTNLHGSFYVGLALVAAMAAGRGFDIFRRRPHFRMVLRDGKFRSLCVVFAGRHGRPLKSLRLEDFS